MGGAAPEALDEGGADPLGPGGGPGGSDAKGTSVLTVGMAKFGLPDLEFGPFSPSDARLGGGLLNLLVQALELSEVGSSSRERN